MKKIRVFMAMFIAFGVAGVFGIFRSGGTASAHPAQQGEELIAAAMAFVDAVNRGDGDKLRQLADPAFQEVSSTGETSDLEEFINYTAVLGVHIAASNYRLIGPDTVSCDAIATGGPLPILPHPWTETGVFTFSNGKIIRLVGTLSAQTAQDLQDLAAAELIASSLAFAEAYNAADTAKMRQLADPSFQQVGGTGDALDLDGFANSTSTGVRVTLSNCRLTGPNVVSCDTVLSGGPIPPLAHPWTETSVLTFANGKIIRLDETLSAQTAQDLQALAAPGMPTTGSLDATPPVVAFLIALLLIANGVLALKSISNGANSR